MDRAHVTVEICIASVEDAVTAAGGGADRVELNAALELGGLTPSLGTLLEVRQTVTLPVIVMARPRPGGFCYSEAEFRTLRRDVDLALEHVADGIAFGVLTPDGRVDVSRCRQVVEQIGARAGGRFQGAVFHRAFDFTPDPVTALDTLIDLGFRRVMTSGQRQTALDGADLIAALLRRAAGRIEILSAGGIRAGNAAEVLARTGCDQLHASLRERRADPSLRASRGATLAASLPLSAQNPGADFDATSSQLLDELLRKVRTPAPTAIKA
jgi:copper homeostasis protein